MNKNDWIWLAGFLDGEGTFTINLRKPRTEKDNPRYEIRIAVSGNEKEIIEWLGKEFNINVQMRMQVNPLYTIDTKKRELIIMILENVISYLKIKKKVAQLLMEFCLSRREIIMKNKVYNRIPYTDREKEIYLIIKEMNRRGKK